MKVSFRTYIMADVSLPTHALPSVRAAGVCAAPSNIATDNIRRPIEGTWGVFFSGSIFCGWLLVSPFSGVRTLK